ncbi:hypothetical protein [Psychrobacter alimentarius]|uniref:hypothetical protein n=1 Tax=Psychrobacter alimentarius TaxID=261164 RepID=UPI003FD118A6
MSEFFLRTESIKNDDIYDLSVISDSDESILKALGANEPCLLEGSRGTGKSFLMKLSELEIEKVGSKDVSVFVTFNKSSLITTEDPLQFYHWMLAKTLKALSTKLRKKGFAVSNLAANLLSNDISEENTAVEVDLKEIVKLFEGSYKEKSEINISSLPDIEDIKEAIQSICEENEINRVFFFFDEAAHVFRPEQQRQFFSLFKDLRSPYITCNAAIYPGVTHFGESFELIHDCIHKTLDRNISDSGYLDYFKSIVMKQADTTLKNKIETNVELFNTLALSCGGNPRMLLRTLQDIKKWQTTSVDTVIKDFYRNNIWSEHTELGDKYEGHRLIIDWGREFLEKKVIPHIQAYNETRREKSLDQSTIYFWVHKDSPMVVKEALRLLTYTGIIRKIDSSVRATRSELGTRYEVKYGCIISLKSNPHSESKTFYNNITIRKFPEFGKNSPSYEGSENILIDNEDENYEKSLRSLLQKSIDVLGLLTVWQKGRLHSAEIHTIGELYQTTEDELIRNISGIGEARSRKIKNAVDSEIVEYISG